MIWMKKVMAVNGKKGVKVSKQRPPHPLFEALSTKKVNNKHHSKAQPKIIGHMILFDTREDVQVALLTTALIVLIALARDIDTLGLFMSTISMEPL